MLIRLGYWCYNPYWKLKHKRALYWTLPHVILKYSSHSEPIQQRLKHVNTLEVYLFVLVKTKHNILYYILYILNLNLQGGVRTPYHPHPPPPSIDPRMEIVERKWSQNCFWLRWNFSFNPIFAIKFFYSSYWNSSNVCHIL